MGDTKNILMGREVREKRRDKRKKKRKGDNLKHSK